MWGTRRDLVDCFVWKQVGLGFPRLASILAEMRRRVVHVAQSRKSREDQVEDGQINARGCIGPFYSTLIVFIVLVHRDSLVF
jgi:hypothetical protein